MELLQLAEPGPENGFRAGLARLLRDSFHRLTGRELIDRAIPASNAGRALYEAPFAILAHGAGTDPTFTYGNRTALALFEVEWRELVTLPSRLSAEPVSQRERARLLKQVTARGFIDDYSGVRISRTGRRFLIRSATIWNLIDETGTYQGQGAMFREWQRLP
jgi:hypothetical protein